MRILYSFNKRGFEAEYWTREIRSASSSEFTFIPFNHDPYLDPARYARAQLLDNIYFARDPGLLRMYAELEQQLGDERVDALIVDNYFPYHPEFLRRLPVYKVMRTTDGPVTAYDRDFAYLHAYDHVLYHSPAYSAELSMPEKLRYCGARAMDFWPHGLFEVAHDPSKTEAQLFSQERDIDVVFIGRLHRGKMEFLARVKKALGKQLRMHGLTSPARNVYWNLKHGFPGWIRPARFEEYVPLYQRARIGFNAHNRGDYTVGSYRLYELPGNGVMQISDGGEHLDAFFRTGEEVVGYRSVDDLIDKIRYYLDHESERQRIALQGYRRVMRDYRYRDLMQRAGHLIRAGMQRAGRLTAEPPANHAGSATVG
jgi:spore maturation protein CgeB